MVRAAVAIRRIAMAGQDDLDSHRFRTGQCRVEVVDLKPQEHAVSVRLEIGIPDLTVVMLNLPMVQLEDQ